MKNKEKFAKEIVEIACSGDVLAVSKVTGKPISCKNTRCEDCNRCNDFPNCEEKRLREWAESEYVEPMRISKMDKAFLNYIHDAYNFVVRNREGKLLLDGSKPWKTDYGVWISISGNTYGLSCFDVKLPMVKREDTEPWKIEDLKELEVVDEY